MLNKQSGIELLSAKRVLPKIAGHTFLKMRVKRQFLKLHSNFLHVMKSSKLKGREKNISKQLLSILC